MNRSLTTWMLGGALAASLSFNLRSGNGRVTSPPPATQGCAVSSCRDLGAAGLRLDAEQLAALEPLCERFCGESERLEQRAAELQRELIAALGASSADEAAARRLAGEIADLRRRSLDACLDGMLAVRKVLTPEQLRALYAACAGEVGTCTAECPPLPAGPKR